MAGFARDDIEIAVDGDKLSIKGSKKVETTATYLYRGIAFRDFTRSFKLGEYIEVHGASLENGLLMVDLVRNVPESAKPKLIEIR